MALKLSKDELEEYCAECECPENCYWCKWATAYDRWLDANDPARWN